MRRTFELIGSKVIIIRYIFQIIRCRDRCSTFEMQKTISEILIFGDDWKVKLP